MTKNISHISQRVICPKCQTKNLRKSVSPNIGKEYFCDKCHVYFGIVELCTEHGYDASDFYSEDGTQLSSSELFRAEFWSGWRKQTERDLQESIEQKKLDSIYFEPEGEWSSEIARTEAYKVVSRMFAGISELEDGFDARDLPAPIGACGGC